MKTNGFRGFQSDEKPSLPEGSPNGRHWSLAAYQFDKSMQHQTKQNPQKNGFFSRSSHSTEGLYGKFRRLGYLNKGRTDSISSGYHPNWGRRLSKIASSLFSTELLFQQLAFFGTNPPDSVDFRRSDPGVGVIDCKTLARGLSEIRG
jgi:hypothetical protein